MSSENLAKTEQVPLGQPNKPNPQRAAVLYALYFYLFPQLVEGISGLPTSRYLLEVIHLSPVALAGYFTITGIPFYFTPLVGTLRDHWSPYRLGDRGYFLLAGFLFAGVCFAVALLPDAYLPFLILCVIFSIASIFTDTASASRISVFSKRSKDSGLIATACMVGSSVIGAVCGAAGGWFAAHTAFHPFVLGFGVAIIAIYAPALWKPAGLDPPLVKPKAKGSNRFYADLKRLLREADYWKVFAFVVIFNVNPVSDAAMLIFYRERLHLGFETIGRLNGLAALCNIPSFLFYGAISRRWDVRKMLFYLCPLIALESLPLLWANSLFWAYVVAIAGGTIGSIVVVALWDLRLRYTPNGLEGVGITLANASGNLMASLTGLFGAYLIQRLGFVLGFRIDVILLMVSWLLLLPALLWLPKRDSAALPSLP